MRLCLLSQAYYAFSACGAAFGGALQKLAPMLEANRTLISLALERAGGQPGDFAVLGGALSRNPLCMLSVLKLAHNHIGDEGARQLASGLQRLRPGLLAELDLTGGQIGAEGMQALLGAIILQKNLLH